MARSCAAVVLALLLSALAGCAAPPTPAPDAPGPSLLPGPFESWNATFDSFDGTRIAYSVWKPEAAGPSARLPVVLQGHPISLQRWTSVHPDLQPFLQAGFGVVAFDQRGHGESGGEAWMLDPDREIRDAALLLDEIAGWDWVLLDGPGDPRIGVTGWSYGGGFQWLLALEETRLTGATRLDALAPQATWFDKVQSYYAPNGVPSTFWVGYQSALAAAGRVRLAQPILAGYASTEATGEPDPVLLEMFERRSPRWYAERGIRADVPALIQQGATDTIFPINEAFHGFSEALTPRARAESVVITHRNAHPIPGVQRNGVDVLVGNPCTGDANWYASQTQVAWFRRHLLGEEVDLGLPVQLATHEGECLRLAALPTAAVPHAAAPLTPAGTPVPLGAGTRAALRLVDGPAAVAGLPALTANVSGLGADARLFFALGVGPDPARLRVAGEQWTPVRGFAAGDLALVVELAGVVERIPAGAGLYLLVAPTAFEHAGHGSRLPGGVLLRDVTVALPLLPDRVPTPATVK